ncbi:recombinase RecF [Deltaproteobacteria bacterium Smac51]|nr:recombinase RecF [Deltaproteobacteria bacterium Smac51]
MERFIQKISIEGFKSIRSLRDFPLNRGLNVLIGANGAGKSNFLEFFKLMEMTALNGLNEYVAKMGGAESFLFQGAAATERIEIKLNISGQSCDSYKFTLNRTVKDSFVESSAITFTPNQRIPDSDDPWAAKDSADAFLHEAVKNWRVYHFQNTTAFSTLRKSSSVHDSDIYYSDGSNIGAFLWGLKQRQPKFYDRIETAVKQILPFFSHFDLNPVKDESQPDNQHVWLYWRQKGSEYRYKPWQFSDGTLRFIALATALLQPNPPAVIVIDEPELGLHPQALSFLAGLMHEAAFKSQLIMATQSPDLLNTMEPEDIITVNTHRGESIFERLKRDNLAAWLEEYAIGDLWWKNVIQAGPNYV